MKCGENLSWFSFFSERKAVSPNELFEINIFHTLCFLQSSLSIRSLFFFSSSFLFFSSFSSRSLLFSSSFFFLSSSFSFFFWFSISFLRSFFPLGGKLEKIQQGKSNCTTKIIHNRLNYFAEDTGNRAAGMAQWWEHSPLTSVAWVQFPDLASHVGWVCHWFSSSLQGFFSGSSGFPPSTKTNIPNSNLIWKQWTRRATQWNVHC